MGAISEFMADLQSRGIILSLADGQLQYRSRKNALSESEKQSLASRRDELVAYLTARNAAKALRAQKVANGPLMPSVAQEMWFQFAGGADEGKPVALNISMVAKFDGVDGRAVGNAIATVIARHDALRLRFRKDGESLVAILNPPENFGIEKEDLSSLSDEGARSTAAKRAQEFCGRVNFILGDWLTRARIFILPGRSVVAAISSAHMVADAGSRNIIVDEIRNLLEGRKLDPCPISYNEFSLAERNFLANPQGAVLIDHWRNWYQSQPTMLSPTEKVPMLWGNGIRIVRNFQIPKFVLDQIGSRAKAMKVTPFLIYLTIFSIALSRWSGFERFPLRVLGDKRTSVELSNTVGLMFCADAMEVHASIDADFQTTMRTIQAQYEASLALRIPSLHFWAPHCVRPGIELPEFGNKIPAVFNYYSAGTAREKAETLAAQVQSANSCWPPELEEIAPQSWPRRSAPVFLHLMDFGLQASGSIHFYANVVSRAEQRAFIARFFEIFSEVLSS